MFADQWEAGHGGMIEADGFPGRFIVAACAIWTVSALVGVFGGMASVAGYRRLFHFGRLLVAASTDCFAMRTLKRETRHPVMIEIDHPPRPRGVAVRTIFAVLTLVCVIIYMTRNTGARRMEIGIALAMTARAAGRGMLAHKRVASARMIKASAFPGRRCMTTGTI
jgi:hypothetical protein